jgi:hypothetical protein
MEITNFRGVKFGEAAPKELKPIHYDEVGIHWYVKDEQQKVGVTLVSGISYGFFKSKFMAGKVQFGGDETFEILRKALTEKYKKPLEKEFIQFWYVGDVEIELVNPALIGEGMLFYTYVPLKKELEGELQKKNAEEMKMKVRAAMGDL